MQLGRITSHVQYYCSRWNLRFDRLHIKRQLNEAKINFLSFQVLCVENEFKPGSAREELKCVCLMLYIVAPTLLVLPYAFVCVSTFLGYLDGVGCVTFDMVEDRPEVNEFCSRTRCTTLGAYSGYSIM